MNEEVLLDAKEELLLFWARHKIFPSKAKKFDNFRFRIFGFAHSTK